MNSLKLWFKLVESICPNKLDLSKKAVKILSLSPSKFFAFCIISFHCNYAVVITPPIFLTPLNHLFGFFIIFVLGFGWKWPKLQLKSSTQKTLPNHCCSLKMQNKLTLFCRWKRSSPTKVSRLMYRFKKVLFLEHLSVDRISLRLEPRGKSLKDEDVVSKLGSTQFYFKDLGPQIAWKTGNNSELNFGKNFII